MLLPNIKVEGIGEAGSESPTPKCDGKNWIDQYERGKEGGEESVVLEGGGWGGDEAKGEEGGVKRGVVGPAGSSLRYASNKKKEPCPNNRGG